MNEINEFFDSLIKDQKFPVMVHQSVVPFGEGFKKGVLVDTFRIEDMSQGAGASLMMYKSLARFPNGNEVFYLYETLEEAEVGHENLLDEVRELLRQDNLLPSP